MRKENMTNTPKNTSSNIFIEGIQGMGKSTLLQTIAQNRPDFHVCREGDYSPLELAWCTWMNEAEYTEVLERYGTLRKEIRENTFRDGNHYIITYTRILTDIPGFHKDLEKYEIYNGRKPLEEMEEIILSRYRRFSKTGYLSECAFLQNIVEDMILYHCLEDVEILEFYRRLYAAVQKNFLLLYLYSEHIDEDIQIIQKERTDHLGNQQWYPLMMQYLINSPYGKAHGYKNFCDLISHLKHRQQLEVRILKEIIGKHALILPAKRWNTDEVLALIS